MPIVLIGFQYFNNIYRYFTHSWLFLKRKNIKYTINKKVPIYFLSHQRLLIHFNTFQVNNRPQNDETKVKGEENDATEEEIFIDFSREDSYDIPENAEQSTEEVLLCTFYYWEILHFY